MAVRGALAACAVVGAVVGVNAALAQSGPHAVHRTVNSVVRTVNGRLLEVGGPTPAGRPLPGTVLFFRGERLVLRVETRPNGTFSAPLRVGRFHVEAFSRMRHIASTSCVGPQTVVVRMSVRYEAAVTIRCEVH